MSDEERLAEIEARLEAFRAPYSTLAVRRADLDDYRWLVDRIQHFTYERRVLGSRLDEQAEVVDRLLRKISALTAERDALVVDRDAWKARCLGHTPAAKEER